MDHIFFAILVGGSLGLIYLLPSFKAVARACVSGCRELNWRMIPARAVWLPPMIVFSFVFAWSWMRLPVPGSLAEEPVAAATFSVISFQGTGLLIVLLVLSAGGVKPREALGLGYAPLQAALIGLVAFILVMPVFFLCYVGWGWLLEHLNMRHLEPQELVKGIAGLQHGRLLLLVLVAGVTPIAEEVYFRGALFPWMSRQWGLGVATLASSLVFAVVHANTLSLAPLFVLSLALTFVYTYTRNILAPIVLHAVFNAMSLLGQFLMDPEAVQTLQNGAVGGLW